MYNYCSFFTGMEFAYSQSPKVLQGLTMGVFLATQSIGNFVASALVNIVESASEKYSSYGNWYADDINKGRLDFFFYVLAGLMGVNIVIFCIISTRYTYVNPNILCEDEEEWKGGGFSTLMHGTLDEENESTPLLNSN